jgi:hypothetical protein
MSMCILILGVKHIWGFILNNFKITGWDYTWFWYCVVDKIDMRTRHSVLKNGYSFSGQVKVNRKWINRGLVPHEKGITIRGHIIVQGFYILIEYADLRPLGIPILKCNLAWFSGVGFCQKCKGIKALMNEYRSSLNTKWIGLPQPDHALPHSHKLGLRYKKLWFQ